MTRGWPVEERFELGAQVRRASSGAPANLAEKHSDRLVRNKIEGTNRFRGEALETIHPRYVARMNQYISDDQYGSFRDPYEKCVRMLNGLEQALERRLPEADRRFTRAAVRHSPDSEE